METVHICTDLIFYSLNANLIAIILGLRYIPTILRHWRIKEVVKETANRRRTLVVNII